MSEATQLERSDSASRARFDDRIDTETRISNLESARIIGRGFSYIATAPRLFTVKMVLTLLAIVPVLYLQWLAKILVDQVILQKPFDATDVVMPPHVQPFIDMVYGYSPFEILVALTIFSVVLLLVFGSRTYVWQDWAQGEDSATPIRKCDEPRRQREREFPWFYRYVDSYPIVSTTHQPHSNEAVSPNGASTDDDARRSSNW